MGKFVIDWEPTSFLKTISCRGNERYHSLILPAKRKRVTELIDARARSVPRHGPTEYSLREYENSCHREKPDLNLSVLHLDTMLVFLTYIYIALSVSPSIFLSVLSLGNCLFSEFCLNVVQRRVRLTRVPRHCSTALNVCCVVNVSLFLSFFFYGRSD